MGFSTRINFQESVSIDIVTMSIQSVQFTLSNGLEAVKNIWNKGDFCDVSLVSQDNKIFEAHKVLLSAHSSVFRSFLSNSAASGFHQKPVMFLFNINSKDVTNVLQFIYSGEISLPQQDVVGFLDASQKLKIQNLCNEGYPEDYYSVSNILDGGQNLEKNVDNLNLEELEERKPLINEVQTSTLPQENGNQFIGDQFSENKDHSSDKDTKEPLNKMVEFSNPAKKTFHLQESDFANFSNFRDFLQTVFSKEEGGKFQCNICEKTSKNRSHAEEHAETHIEGLKYPCKQCDVICNNRVGMRKHQRENHRN